MVSKTAMQAVRACVHLASLPDGCYEGAATIAKSVGARGNYLGKLLQLLSQEGLLVSQKGLHGGFRLSRPAASITLFDVIDPVDHVARWEGCFLGRDECNADPPCVVHGRWGVIRDEYLDFIRNTTIAEVAGVDPI